MFNGPKIEEMMDGRKSIVHVPAITHLELQTWPEGR